MWNCKGEASNQSGHHNGGDALWVRSQETPLKGSGRKIIALATAEGNGLRNVLCHYSWLFQTCYVTMMTVMSSVLSWERLLSFDATDVMGSHEEHQGDLVALCDLWFEDHLYIYNITICNITYIYNCTQTWREHAWNAKEVILIANILLSFNRTAAAVVWHPWSKRQVDAHGNLFKASPVLHNMNLKVSTSNPLRGKFELQREQRVKRWNIEVWWSGCLAIPPTSAHSDILLSGDTMPIRARLHSCCLMRIDWLRVVTWSEPKRSSSPAGTCFRHRL